MKTKHIIIVTGLSGAGKTTALNILEDMNYYTIDNLPLGLEKSLLDTEIEKLAVLDKKADEAYFKCKKIVKRLLPEMNLVIGEYTFDEGKLIFYFTANNRLDFRELVKEVNKTFKKRVEFYQIKTNDEGRILSAFGKYGREIYW